MKSDKGGTALQIDNTVRKDPVLLTRIELLNPIPVNFLVPQM